MFSIIILACALSFDALSVGFTYSLKGIKIPVVSKLLIYIVSFCCAFISSAAGERLSQLLPYGFDQILSIIMLASLGAYLILSEYKVKKEKKKKKKEFCYVSKLFGFTVTIISNPTVGDYNNSKIIEPAEAIYIGLALSLDCIGAGFGYGISSANIWVFPFFIGLFQIFLISVGGFIGRIFSNLPINNKITSLLPGIILIILSAIKLAELFN